MAMTVREILKRLREDGWVLKNVRGSHHNFTHPTKPGKVTVAYNREGAEIGGGTLSKIFKQAGWKQ
jgi:predicted RNA binding protein YcfA (HicA-like mRNA interferase family)